MFLLQVLHLKFSLVFVLLVIQLKPQSIIFRIRERQGRQRRHGSYHDDGSYDGQNDGRLRSWRCRSSRYESSHGLSFSSDVVDDNWPQEIGIISRRRRGPSRNPRVLPRPQEEKRSHGLGLQGMEAVQRPVDTSINYLFINLLFIYCRREPLMKCDCELVCFISIGWGGFMGWYNLNNFRWWHNYGWYFLIHFMLLR